MSHDGRKFKHSSNMEISQAIVVFSLMVLLTSTKDQKQHICGKPSGNEFRLENERIVAGYDMGYYRYPWFASLIRYGQVVCGASLVGPSTVVTAAHCYKEFLDLASKGYLRLETVYTVKLGVYNICQSEPTQQEYKIEKVYIHELYATKKPYFDICLLTLSGDTSDYQPICLPAVELRNRPSEGTVPGLGTIKYQGSMPCTLHEARLLIYNDKECYNMMNNTGNDPKAIKNAFCAGYMQGGIDTCQGDSGGPLQAINDNGDYFLIGIVSFGFHCAVPGLLGIYTDVSQYLDWIQEKSGLDAGIVNIIYNKTSLEPGKPVTEAIRHSTTQGPHRRKHHHGKPYHKPLRIIVYKNNRLVLVTKPVLHHPITRNNN